MRLALGGVLLWLLTVALAWAFFAPGSRCLAPFFRSFSASFARASSVSNTPFPVAADASKLGSS
jgi:hypothetical protein